MSAKILDKKLTLAFETSCDETCCAIVDDELNILSSIVSSQIDIHKRFGGVVPEVASRNHLLSIEGVFTECLTRARVTLEDISQIAVTTQPGLVGAVMVGRVFAESFATALGKPIIEINHLHGHIASVALSNINLVPPFLTLVVSGGHTSIYKVTMDKKADESGDWICKLLFATTDDACGEAFDKVAKILGLPYPGGPEVSRQAEIFETRKLNSPQEPLIQFVTKPNYKREGFSYSGLKTAVLNYVNRQRQLNAELDIQKICSSFQSEAIDQLVSKCIETLKKHKIKKLCICGGVSANMHLREKMSEACNQIGAELYLPELSLCGDNAAMIAAAAILGLRLE